MSLECRAAVALSVWTYVSDLGPRPLPAGAQMENSRGVKVDGKDTAEFWMAARAELDPASDTALLAAGYGTLTELFGVTAAHEHRKAEPPRGELRIVQQSTPGKHGSKGVMR